MNIKKGDTIKIISGNDKGKQAKVTAVFPEESRIAADGINVKKKHVRPRRQDQKGELVRISGAFSVSRAMLVCPKCSQPTRVKHSSDEQGRKTRVCRHCGSVM